jgi:hypothetical protein
VAVKLRSGTHKESKCNEPSLIFENLYGSGRKDKAKFATTLTDFFQSKNLIYVPNLINSPTLAMNLAAAANERQRVQFTHVFQYKLEKRASTWSKCRFKLRNSMGGGGGVTQ